MIDKEEILRSQGKVEATDDFTKRTVRKIERIVKTREFIEFVFLVWSELLVLSFRIIEKIFEQKIKKI